MGLYPRTLEDKNRVVVDNNGAVKVSCCCQEEDKGASTKRRTDFCLATLDLAVTLLRATNRSILKTM